jgi:hypothetical protein
MAFVPPKDRVLEPSTSNSQTVFTVTGALDTSYNAFSASMSVGDTTIGGIVEAGTAFKSGLLTYSNTNEVTVTTAFESKGTFSAGGTKQVFMGGPASRALMIDGAQTLTAAQKSQARRNISAVLRGQIAGLTLSTAGSSATFGIAAGEAADSTASDLMALASAFTKTTTNWAVGSGNGGMMTGSINGNTWYNVWLIKRPDTGVVDVVTDTIANGTTNISTLASGAYTIFRRIGCMKTDGSSLWTKFIQLGDKFLWAVPIQDDTSAVGTTAALVTLSVPPGIQVDAEIFGLAQNAAAGTTWAITSPDQADTLPSTTLFTGIIGVAAVNTMYSQTVRTSTSGQVRKRASAASTTIYINTFGWRDRLDRDA